jgi:hypothetical protein
MTQERDTNDGGWTQDEGEAAYTPLLRGMRSRFVRRGVDRLYARATDAGISITSRKSRYIQPSNYHTPITNLCVTCLPVIAAEDTVPSIGPGPSLKA